MKRRILLGIGAALLVGGWGTCGYAKAHDRIRPPPALQPPTVTMKPKSEWPAKGPGENPFEGTFDVDFGDPPPKRIHPIIIYRYGIAAMAVGAGLIGFVVLRPTNRN